uniref:Uncharacterized protein n=1 Tax=Rhizophora mucronata TaxID=61149 RepID=A0A2P2QC07_RHIMU
MIREAVALIYSSSVLKFMYALLLYL